ncbi:MAG: sugar phosphate isomerase/epimerase [Firmicutes bacterium]|nr:sugar phosphate isomerase/epimerase [Bacillota bacterium]
MWAMDRVGIITDEVSSDLGEALDFAALRGLRHVELRAVGKTNLLELDDAQIAQIGAAIADRGLVVSCIASPVFKCALSAERSVAAGDRFGERDGDVAHHRQLLRRAADVAMRLGTTRIRIFAFWRERDPDAHEAEIVGHLREAADFAEARGLRLLLENEPACNGGFADEVARLARAVNSPALSVVWDPGNEAFAGRPAFAQGYDAVRDLLTHVHLKDVVQNDDGSRRFAPIGQGVVNYRAQLQALCDDGYDGWLTLEPHLGASAPAGADVAATVDGLFAILRSIEPGASR